jgi:ATP-binding cassette, subfamily B (MDR/TAP), member 1
LSLVIFVSSRPTSVLLNFPHNLLTRRPVAYIRSWKLSLAISSILPCIAIIGGFLGFFLSRYRTQQLTHQAHSGSLAEEVIATIRTAHAFDVRHSLGTLFDKHVELGHAVEIKMAIVTGIGLSAIFFAIYAAYGLGETLSLRQRFTPRPPRSLLSSLLIRNNPNPRRRE